MHRAELRRILEINQRLNSSLSADRVLEQAIDAAIEPFRDDPALMMSTVCTRMNAGEAVADPNVVKVVADVRGFALYFSRSPIPYPRGTVSERGPYKHLGLYVYRREFLRTIAALDPTPLERRESLEQLRVLENGFAIKVIETRHDSIGVDTPEDLEHVRRLLTAGARA